MPPTPTQPPPTFRLSPPRPPIRSARAATVARWFGLTPDRSTATPHIPYLPLPRPGQILLISGPSGSGKSLLLNHYRARAARGGAPHAPVPINLPLLRLPGKPLPDCFPRLPLPDALRLLARVGLAEAWTCLQTPAELSEGQRWRLRLAIAIHRSGQCPRPRILLADEFAALLDRVTARIVASLLRRSVSRTPGLSAIVATSHDDLEQALAPDQHIFCDFGEMNVLK